MGRKVISRTIHLLLYIYHLFLKKNIFKININKWFFLNGNEKYLFSHKELNVNSIVFEVGGYTGVFSDRIIELYNPYIYIFEPVKEFYEILVEKYKNNKKIRVFHFGLSDNNSTLKINLSKDASSLYKKDGVLEEITIKDIIFFLKEEKLENSPINLISINIEGGEYSLLNRLLEENSNFEIIQVQFHDFVENAEEKRIKIINTIHKLGYKDSYSFPFVWECFKK